MCGKKVNTLALVLGLGISSVWAGVPSDWSVLKSAAIASKNLPMTATYLHQVGDTTQTFSLIRDVEKNGAVLEKREILDGMPQSIIRIDNATTCYAPNQAALNQAKANAAEPFPLLLPESIDTLPTSYRLIKRDKGRVAGRDCTWYELEPKDPSTRYSHLLCLDNAKALPLKLEVLDAKRHPIEQFSFIDLHFSAPKKRTSYVSSYPFSAKIPNTIRTGENEVMPAHILISGIPAGYKLTKVVERKMTNHKSHKVEQLLYSDGLAMFSLFVENNGMQAPIADSVHAYGNGMSVATHMAGPYKLTLVGDLPPDGALKVVRNLRIAKN